MFYRSTALCMRIQWHLNHYTIFVRHTRQGLWNLSLHNISHPKNVCTHLQNVLVFLWNLTKLLKFLMALAINHTLWPIGIVKTLIIWMFCPSQTYTDLKKLLIVFHSKLGQAIALARAEVKSVAERHTAGICMIILPTQLQTDSPAVTDSELS